MINTLLQQHESKTLEFKQDLSSPRGVLKTLVAFANSAGGRLVLGVCDDKRIVGVADPLAEEERICSLISDSIEPRLVPSVELVTVQDKTLLIVELHRSSQGIVFDELPMPELDKSALDLDAAQELFGQRRELTDKALVHADYSQRGTPIRVAFFDDRIEVDSPGYLLPGMTIEDMKSGVSRIRNPVIARVFRELQLFEQWGSGVQRIFAKASAEGLPEPQITEMATGVRFTVWLKVHNPVAKVSEPDQQANAEHVKIDGPSSIHQVASKHPSSSQQVSHQVTELLLQHKGELNRAELMKRLDLKDRVNFKRNYLDPALVAGLIEMTQPDSPRSPTQKYRLTATGQALRAKLARQHSGSRTAD